MCLFASYNYFFIFKIKFTTYTYTNVSCAVIKFKKKQNIRFNFKTNSKYKIIILHNIILKNFFVLKIFKHLYHLHVVYFVDKF